ncbi:MAG TPA: cutinase family protein [Mycobacteriales bacterium]|nr:cutinase family protein [Mycobacteriales bacterium]
MQRITRLALATVTIAASLVLCPFNVSIAAATDCPQYVFIGARGSGPEKVGVNDHNLGQTLGAEYNDLMDLVGSYATVVPDPVDYPAKGVISLRHPSQILTGLAAGLQIPAAYHKSAMAGTAATIAEVKKYAACDSTKVILAGYSQGAQAVADALQRDVPGLLQSSRMLGATFFADPYFNPKSWADRDTFSGHRWGLLGIRPEYPSEYRGRVWSYCGKDDPICQGIVQCTWHICGYAPFSFTRHTKYWNGPEPEQAAEELAKLIRDDEAHNGTPQPEPNPGPLSGPLDVAFAIDSTGSMGDIIDSVKDDVTNLAATLRNVDPDLRVGLVDFKDAEPYSGSDEDPYQARVDLPFSSDLDAFNTAVDGLSAQGGGDDPESINTGMMTALGLSWRNGAHKELIAITDTDGHDVDPITGYTVSDVIKEARALDPVVINAVPASDDADEYLAPIAAATGGSDFPTTDDAGPAIAQTLQAAQTAPIAALDEPSVEGPATTAINFSAAASYSPLGRSLTYGWDYNDDGTIDETTDVPVVSHTFVGGYNGLIVLTVTDDHGQNAVAQEHVTASGPAPAAPGVPSLSDPRAGNHHISLVISPGQGDSPSLYRISDAGGRQVRIIEAADDAQRVVVKHLPNGSPIRLQAVAINPAGISEPSSLTRAVTPTRHKVRKHAPTEPTFGGGWCQICIKERGHST